MTELWVIISGGVIGGIVTTVGNLIVNHFQTAKARKLGDKRKALLKTMLSNAGPTGWRKMDTMANVIGASRDETARLLIELDARSSENGKDIWAFIDKQPLPNPDQDNSDSALS